MVSPKINENKRFLTQNFCSSQKNIYCSLVQYQSVSPQDKLFKFNQTKTSESKFENYLKDYKINSNINISNVATFKNDETANNSKNTYYKDDPNINYSNCRNTNNQNDNKLNNNFANDNKMKEDKNNIINKRNHSNNANCKYDNGNNCEKSNLKLNLTNNSEISYFDGRNFDYYSVSVSSKFCNSTNNANNHNNYKKVIENQKKFLGNRNKMIYNTIAGRSTSPNYLSYQDYLKEKKGEFK